MRKITQIPGQLTLDLFEVQAKESPNPSQTKPKKKVAKTEETKREESPKNSAKAQITKPKKTKASVTSKKRTSKPYTKKQLEDAVEIANTEGFVSVGKFINRFRVSARCALGIFGKLVEDGVISENGKAKKKGKR